MFDGEAVHCNETLALRDTLMSSVGDKLRGSDGETVWDGEGLPVLGRENVFDLDKVSECEGVSDVLGTIVLVFEGDDDAVCGYDSDAVSEGDGEKVFDGTSD